MLNIPAKMKKLNLFSGLTEQESEALLQDGRMRSCPQGQMLFAHGEQVTHFYIIARGAFQLFRATPDGHQKTLEILKSGQTICKSEIMDTCRSHRVNAVAIEDAEVLEFPAKWLKQAAQKHPPLALNLLSAIAGQAHMAEVEAEHQATMSAAQLVACFLQRLCVLYEFDPKGFDLPYSKTLIASRLGMELETFSRTLAKLKDQGIRVEGMHVSIHDLEKIEHYVCDFCSISDECTTHKILEKKHF